MGPRFHVLSSFFLRSRFPGKRCKLYLWVYLVIISCFVHLVCFYKSSCCCIEWTCCSLWLRTNITQGIVYHDLTTELYEIRLTDVVWFSFWFIVIVGKPEHKCQVLPWTWSEELHTGNIIQMLCTFLMWNAKQVYSVILQSICSVCFL